MTVSETSGIRMNLHSRQSSYLAAHSDFSHQAFPALFYFQGRGATLGTARGEEIGVIKRVILDIYPALPLAILAFHLRMNLPYLSFGIPSL